MLAFYLKLGFFVGLGLGVLFTSLSTTELTGEGVTTTETRNFLEYLTIVLKWGFVTSFISGIISFLLGDFLERK